MKIKKEYGEQVYKAALYSEGTNDFIGRLINGVFNPGWIWENNGFPCNIFTDDKLGFVFEDFEDMCLTADPDLERNENIKDFFNEYVEGGYQEPLYYVKDEFTGQRIYEVRDIYEKDSYLKWFTQNQSRKFKGGSSIQAKHTKQEWLDINPAYEKMLVEVEE